MDFVQHTLAWVRGEVFEAQMMAAAGGVLVVGAAAFWRVGTTPAAKSLVLPLLALGALLVVMGISGSLSNGRRIAEFTEAFEVDSVGFVASERVRVEGFRALYTFTLIMASVSFAGGAAIFWLTLSPTARGIAVGLILLGLTGLVIDFFSKERADIYYAEILAAEAGSP